jgi:hypothetical protein
MLPLALVLALGWLTTLRLALTLTLLALMCQHMVQALPLLMSTLLAMMLPLLASMCQHMAQALLLLMSTLLATLARMQMAAIPAATLSRLQEAAQVEEVEEAVAESCPWEHVSTDDALLPTLHSFRRDTVCSPVDSSKSNQHTYT